MPAVGGGKSCRTSLGFRHVYTTFVPGEIAAACAVRGGWVWARMQGGGVGGGEWGHIVKAEQIARRYARARGKTRALFGKELAEVAQKF